MIAEPVQNHSKLQTEIATWNISPAARNGFLNPTLQEKLQGKLHRVTPSERRISCHGKNHSNARCKQSYTQFLCYHHYREYSLLGWKFSTLSEQMLRGNRSTVVVKFFKMAERLSDCSGETLFALCARKKRLLRKMTEGYYWIGTREGIGMFSKSWNDRNTFLSVFVWKTG